mmetsp:Transcript_22589/g.58924  ORF Transcript_22589/g.58924 Transcript_22589/m.58924 type:complete len:291 (-) Transcript_22589:984-1856(-)
MAVAGQAHPGLRCRGEHAQPQRERLRSQQDPVRVPQHRGRRRPARGVCLPDARALAGAHGHRRLLGGLLLLLTDVRDAAAPLHVRSVAAVEERYRLLPALLVDLRPDHPDAVRRTAGYLPERVHRRRLGAEPAAREHRGPRDVLSRRPPGALPGARRAGAVGPGPAELAAHPEVPVAHRHVPPLRARRRALHLQPAALRLPAVRGHDWLCGGLLHRVRWRDGPFRHAGRFFHRRHGGVGRGGGPGPHLRLRRPARTDTGVHLHHHDCAPPPEYVHGDRCGHLLRVLLPHV